MKAVRLVDSTLRDAPPAFFAIAEADERRFKSAVMYCVFSADEADVSLHPMQVGRLLERFYGFASCAAQPAEALDIAAERATYHVRGRPLPMKAALIRNAEFARESLLTEIERFGLLNADEY